jgi:hypothetical protein
VQPPPLIRFFHLRAHRVLLPRPPAPSSSSSVGVATAVSHLFIFRAHKLASCKSSMPPCTQFWATWNYLRRGILQSPSRNHGALKSTESRLFFADNDFLLQTRRCALPTCISHVATSLIGGLFSGTLSTTGFHQSRILLDESLGIGEIASLGFVDPRPRSTP